MNDQCEELGSDYCLKVYYEQLILHPRKWLTKILKFLELDWTEDVMHHEKQINKAHGISLSKVERSSDQVSNFGLKLPSQSFLKVFCYHINQLLTFFNIL